MGKLETVGLGRNHLWPADDIMGSVLANHWRQTADEVKPNVGQ